MDGCSCLRWILFQLLAAVIQGRVQQVDVTGMVGDVVRLPCEIDEEKCGEMHNVQWYRGDGDTRVFIYSQQAEVDASENMLQGRGYFDYRSGWPLTELEIRQLRADDESLYKCELTYLEVRDNCAVIQFVNLTTIAKPESVAIVREDGTEVQHGTEIGPLEEGTELVLTCRSEGGKPPAAVTWWNDTINMGGDAGAVLQDDGTGEGTNTLRVQLSRHDLGAGFECQATNAAVEHPLRKKIYLDVQVGPLSIELTGLDEPVLEGASVTLTCRVTGARPAANVTWLRGGQQLEQHTDNTDTVQPDRTTETVSRYTLVAERGDNGAHIVCTGANAVLQSKELPPLRAAGRLDVHYAPAVTVSPQNATVNETMDLLLFCVFDANPTNLTAVIWYKDGRQLEVSGDGAAGGSEKYAGGTVDEPALFIHNVSRRDAGRYRCEVANRIGGGMADNEAVVDVHFAPDVRLTMSPESVVEADQENVTFRCDVSDGRPAQLTRVRWYLDGELLRELPECNDTLGDASYDYGDDQLDDSCNSNPSEMIFLNVDRTFLANYSCAGMNSAGWGPRSQPRQFIIHYPPNRAALVYEPATVLKGSAVTLTCVVDDPGYPPANKYVWMRGSHVITDVTQREWRIGTVSLEDKANFSCVAMNDAGNSAPAHVALDVQTKPQFIDRLPKYLAALRNASTVSVTCRVECSPLCDLYWLKNDEVIDEESEFYSIKTSVMDIDLRLNDFESVVSTLTWNMTAWPGGVLDRRRDNADYTCRSSANAVGPAVSSTTLFTVQYAPENITVSSAVVDVVEGEALVPVQCSADAYPTANYIWKYNEEAILTGPDLTLKRSDGIQRSQAGSWECHAQNQHGAASTSVLVNVFYVPECRLRQEERDDQYVLVCEADAVPDQVTFTWMLDNQTLADGIETDGLTSVLRVQPADDEAGPRGTYSCVANNTVGAGPPCTVDVTGVGGWGMQQADMDLIIMIAAIAAALLLLLIVCIILIVCCRRRRRAKEKLDAAVEKRSPDGAAPPESAAVYENLPFHGMQQPPAKPLGPWTNMEYADVDYKSYGPINYKQESQRAVAEKRADAAGAGGRPGLAAGAADAGAGPGRPPPPAARPAKISAV